MMIDAGDLQLWAERRGDPGDPPVLLIMGSMAQSIGWPEALVDRLVDGGRQVIRYDHRDTGRSDSVDFDAKPYTVLDMAADAVAVLDGLGIASAHLVGASMGALLAQIVAITDPGRVRSLTTMMARPIVDLPGLPPPDAAYLARTAELEKLPRDTVEQRVAADVEVFEAQNGTVLPYDRDAGRDLAERYFARARDWTRARNHWRASGTPPDTMPPITAPTMVLAATADPIFPMPHSVALAGLIPGSRLVEVTGMGHTFLSPGLPEKVADLILQHTGSAEDR